MKVIEYRGHISRDSKELHQINRIKDIVINWGSQSQFITMYILLNVNYFHDGLDKEWNSDEWNGEIDMIVLCNKYFIIFELKNKKGIIKGQTKKGAWGIKYGSDEMFKYEKDYYSQCSRMKTYFSQNYWPKNIIPNIKEESKLKPDVLLIFQNGSDLSNFKYTPSHRLSVEDYEIIMEKTNKNDKIFIKKNFYYNDQQNVYLSIYGANLINDNILLNIYNNCGIENRVKKWFKVLTEDKIEDLLPSLGSDTFIITDQIIDIIINDFKLKKTNEHFA